jgi:hypothetical protein
LLNATSTPCQTNKIATRVHLNKKKYKFIKKINKYTYLKKKEKKEKKKTKGIAKGWLGHPWTF